MKVKIAMVAMMATAIVVTSAVGQNASKQSANEKTTFLGGAGATKCSKWLIQRHSAPGHDPILEFGLLSWVAGFVSGANLGTTTVGGSSEFLFEFADEDVFARVDFYCREHPSDMLYRAAAFVTADLIATVAAKSLKKAR